MNIVMVSGHACIRVQKMSLPLIQAGHKVHLVARKIPSLVENYASFHLYHDVEQLIEILRLFQNVDVFHCHNEPSWFVTAIKEFSDVPVVLDVHDTYLTRLTPEQHDKDLSEGRNAIRITAEERLNFQLADGLVHVNERVRDVVNAEFKPDSPNIILPSYLPRMLYKYDLKEWLGGLVYEGKVMLPEEIKSRSANNGFEYCDYLEVARQADELDMNFHLYAARRDNPFIEAYKDLVFCHPPVKFSSLIGAISRHDWGLVGNVYPTSQWDYATPNKLFDYMAACVPVAVMNASWCADFVERHGVGIVVEDVAELAGRWSEHRKCRENVVKKRQKFAMDNHIHRLERLYKEVS